MKFRTEFMPERSSLTLSPEKPVVLAGSCFSQNISAKMNSSLWKATNPLGTLYNPYSICAAIDLMLDEEEGARRFEESLFEFNGIWNSRYFDSSFSAIDKEDCKKEFINRQKEFLENISAGEILIVTFGTSICYHLQQSDEIVGNCHKQPSGIFYRKRMTTEEIKKCWDFLIVKLKGRFPGIKIIFTVSPVRHLKDGFEGNSRSKAILLLSVEEICLSHKDCHYFPAYELLMDDLRDYRFYASDLVHPSEEGIEYVWEIFQNVFLDERGRQLIREGNKKSRASLHRPKTGAMGKPLAEG